MSKNTVVNWEKGVGGPGVDDLAAMGENGFDVGYIVTGTSHGAPANGVQQSRAEYQTPAREVAQHIATMTLSSADAARILDLASRLANSK